MNNTYQAVMARKNEIMKNSVGIDYSKYEYGTLAFDYEAMMNDCQVKTFSEMTIPLT